MSVTMVTMATHAGLLSDVCQILWQFVCVAMSVTMVTYGRIPEPIVSVTMEGYHGYFYWSPWLQIVGYQGDQLVTKATSWLPRLLPFGYHGYSYFRQAAS